MRFPLRRIVLGFAVGAGAGWVASLLRRPKDAPPGTGADAAEHMPQEEFGELATEGATEGAEEIAQEPTAPAEHAEHAEPRKAVPEMVTPPPGREHPPAADEAGAEPAKPTKAARKAPAKRAPRKAATEGAARTAVEAVAEPVTEAVREGREAMNEHLAGLEEAATPPPPEPATTRRRRKTP